MGIKPEFTYHEIWKIVYNLESEQIKTGVGMTKTGDKIVEEDKKKIMEEMKKKIDSKGASNNA